MKASDLLVECLEVEGVEYAFGLPGEELEDLLFSLRDSSVEFVPVRHEQGAAFMADVHGRLTGEAGVCIGTLGPGATNLLTGVADAHLDKSPLVAITGQAGLERLHVESHQRLDVVDMFEPITKWNAQINDTEIVTESVRKAFKLAELEKPGATHLEFPEDIAAEPVDRRPMQPRGPVYRPAPDAGELDRAVEVLAEAERPVVLAGNGAVRSRCSDRLRRFVDETGMPVVGTYMGKGAVSDEDPHSLMTLDSGRRDQAAQVVDRADAVLAVGYDIAEHDPEGWNPDRQKRVVHLDSEPAEVYVHYDPDVELVCDVAAGVEALLERDVPATDPAWYRPRRESLAEEVSQTPDPGEPFTVEGVLPHLRGAMADEDVLISDVGSHKLAIARQFPTYEPNTCIISNGLASMGIAVPGAVAADLAVESNVVAATGDGGFLMNAAELEVATRLELGFTVVVFRDDDYGLISEQQRASRGEAVGTRLGNPDFVRFGESFGVDSYRPDSWEGVAARLQEVVPSDDLTLVEVPVEGTGAVGG